MSLWSPAVRTFSTEPGVIRIMDADGVVLRTVIPTHEGAACERHRQPDCHDCQLSAMTRPRRRPDYVPRLNGVEGYGDRAKIPGRSGRGPGRPRKVKP